MDSAVVAFLDAIFSVMLYPDDPSARTGAFRDAIFAGSGEALRDRWEDDPDGQRMIFASYRRAADTGKASPEYLRDFQSRVSGGNMSGLILAALVEMQRMGIPPNVSLAVRFAQKEEHRGVRWIRESWSRFKAVSPLWLAWNRFLIDLRGDEITTTSLPQNQHEADYFLGWARYLFDFAMQADGIGFVDSVRAVNGVDLSQFYKAIRPSPGPYETKILPDVDRDLIAAIHRPAGRPATKT